MDRIRWELFYSSNKHFVFVCIYVSIGEAIGVHAGWVVFFSFFSPSIVFTFLLSLGWGFFLFHSNGFLRRLAYYKACLFSHHIFYFRISPAKTASIGYLASSLLFFFLRLAGRIFSSERKKKKGRERLKKKRCDGWKGEGGETMEVSLFSLVG